MLESDVNFYFRNYVIVHDSLKMCYVYNHTCNHNESLITPRHLNMYVMLCYVMHWSVKDMCWSFQPWLPFGLFWKGLPEIKWFVHLATFCLFQMLKKMVYFKACFEEILAKIILFNEILTFKFDCHFNKFS